ETAAEVAELFATALRPGICAGMNAGPQPGHRHAVPVNLKLAFQQRPPDGSHDVFTANARQPFVRSLPGKSPPILFSLEIKCHQSKSDSADQTAGLEAQQIERRHERINSTAQINTDRALVPDEFIRQTQFADQIEDRCVGQEQMVVGFFEISAEEAKSGG